MKYDHGRRVASSEASTELVKYNIDQRKLVKQLLYCESIAASMGACQPNETGHPFVGHPLEVRGFYFFLGCAVTLNIK